MSRKSPLTVVTVKGDFLIAAILNTFFQVKQCLHTLGRLELQV